MKFISEIPIGKEFRLEKNGPIYTRVRTHKREAFEDKDGAVFTCSPRQLVWITSECPMDKDGCGE